MYNISDYLRIVNSYFVTVVVFQYIWYNGAMILLGDLVEKALSLIGVTQERVRALTGKCKCAERKVFLNLLHRWALTVVGKILTGRMSVADAKRHYDTIMGDFENVIKSQQQG